MRAIVCGLFVVLLAPPAATACEVYRFAVAFGENTKATMIANGGKDCVVRLRLDPGAEIASNELSIQPSHGGARADGTFGASYRSNPGYKGRDQFAFKVCGKDGSRSGCSEITVNVRVR